METVRLEFDGGQGAKLAARLDLPNEPPRAYALFAHCFTCSKDLNATRRIAAALSAKGIAVLRFDFTGLGSSQGEFASTNFSSNIADLVRAAAHLRDNYQAPSLLIGHSLGGAAVLAAAREIPEVKAVATIGAPADAGHVIHNFSADLDRIKTDGKAEVSLGGRQFTIEKQFLDDLEQSSLKECIAGLKRALLILHSPVDQTVGIDNASEIFMAARHPKSFISLDHADHLLTGDEDARFVANTIAAWSERYVGAVKADGDAAAGEHTGVTVSETGNGKFQNLVRAGSHRFFADEPKPYGGTDTGPSPYDFLSIALGACTTMTLRMYADHKNYDIGRFSVAIDHEKIHAKDCMDCSEEVRSSPGKIDRFHRRITVAEDIDAEMQAKLLTIADKCPVHKTLHSVAAVTTELRAGGK